MNEADDTLAEFTYNPKTAKILVNSGIKNISVLPNETKDIETILNKVNEIINALKK